MYEKIDFWTFVSVLPQFYWINYFSKKKSKKFCLNYAKYSWFIYNQDILVLCAQHNGIKECNFLRLSSYWTGNCGRMWKWSVCRQQQCKPFCMNNATRSRKKPSKYESFESAVNFELCNLIFYMVEAIRIARKNVYCWMAKKAKKKNR